MGLGRSFASVCCTLFETIHGRVEYLGLIGNRTSCRLIRSVIILVIKQIGLPLLGRPILLITRMITDRIGLHSVLLPLPVRLFY